jgi:hypothetical protein
MSGMGAATVIILPGVITSLIPDTGVRTIGPTGSIITGRTTIQQTDITTPSAVTGGVMCAVITGVITKDGTIVM